MTGWIVRHRLLLGFVSVALTAGYAGVFLFAPAHATVVGIVYIAAVVTVSLVLHVSECE